MISKCFMHTKQCAAIRAIVFGILGRKSESNEYIDAVDWDFYLAAINTEWYAAAKPKAEKCQTTTDEPSQQAVFLLCSGHYITSTPRTSALHWITTSNKHRSTNINRLCISYWWWWCLLIIHCFWSLSYSMK